MAHKASNPYVGPTAFTRRDQDRLYGRSVDLKQLLILTIAQRIVLLYSPSGAGKTSLIQAKLIPALEARDFFVLPIIRINKDPETGSSISNTHIYSTIVSLEGEGLVEDHPQEDEEPFAQDSVKKLDAEDDVPHGAIDLPSYWQGRRDQIGDDQQIVLVFDQFEEIITHNAPAYEQKKEFFDQLGVVLEGDRDLWALFTIREDYLAELDPYRHLIPGGLLQSYRLELLTVDQAREAITRPAETVNVYYTEAAVDKLIGELRQIRTVAGASTEKKGRHVEPVILQVVCDTLWKKLQPEINGTIDVDDLTGLDVDEALGNYYEDVLKTSVSHEVAEAREVREFIDRQLIADPGVRRLVMDSEITIDQTLLGKLVKEHLIRAEVRRDHRYYELAHDRLVEPIRQRNATWFQQHRDWFELRAGAWFATKDNALLLQGEELTRGENWAKDRAPDKHESEFLQRSQQAEEKRQELEQKKAEEEKRRQVDVKRRRVESMERLIAAEREKYLSETGWGVIFADDAGPAVREALSPLLEHRLDQATLKRADYYREFSGPDGHQPNESAREFLSRHGMGVGALDFAAMPYYLLIVGSPERIPWEFQYQLGINYAVGRIDFEDQDAHKLYALYKLYAQSVIRAETSDRRRAKELAAFSPAIPDDPATQMATRELTDPFVEKVRELRPDWEVTYSARDAATKAKLGRLLGGPDTPAVLFTVSHGLEFRKDHPEQLARQGALICQNWPGPRAWSGKDRFLPDFYFAADDVAEDADLHGLVALFFASYGGGTPYFDDFARQRGTERKAIAPNAFVARLPQRILGHPKGGALAVIAHVERPWSFSYKSPTAGSKTGVDTFAEIMSKIMDGYPVGAAVDVLQRRFPELTSELAMDLNEIYYGKRFDERTLTAIWTQTIDARNWIVLGDPAAKAMIEGASPDKETLMLVYDTARLRESGNAAARQGNIELAEKYYLRVLDNYPWLELDPKAEAVLQAATSMFREARTSTVDRAMGLIEEALELDSQQTDRAITTLLVSGDGRAAAADYDGAVKLYRKATEIDPELKPAAEERARLGVLAELARQGREEVRRDNMDEAVGRFKTAIELCRKLDATLDAVAFMVDLGYEILDKGGIEDVVAAFGKASEIEPELDAPSLMIELGYGLALRGDLEPALDVVETTLRLDPAPELRAEAERMFALMKQGMESAQEGQVKEAIERYEEALRLNIDAEHILHEAVGQIASENYLEKGDKAAEEGRLQQAQAFYLQAKSLNRALDFDPSTRAEQRAALLFFNGINGATGEYDFPPVSIEEMVSLILGRGPAENQANPESSHQQNTGRHL